MPAPEGNKNGVNRPGQKKRGAPVGTKRAKSHTIKYRDETFARVSKPWLALVESHGADELLTKQRHGALTLVAAARHALRFVEDEDAATELEGRIEELEDMLREFRPAESAIFL